MFRDPYHFRRLFEKPAKNSKYLKSTTTYEFSSDKHKYLVNVEEYKHDIFIIKFFLKTHKNNNKRYNLLSHEGKCSRIIATCIQIMMSIFKKHSSANFGFMGAHTIDLSKKFEEKRANTKRFRVYKGAIEDLFGTEAFTHFMNEENSTYLLVNNKVDSLEVTSNAANTMFIEIFPQLSGI